MGGECNYLLRVNDDYNLEFVDDRQWKSDCMLGWTEAQISQLLKDAEAVLLDTAKHLRLPVKAGLKPQIPPCILP